MYIYINIYKYIYIYIYVFIIDAYMQTLKTIKQQDKMNTHKTTSRKITIIIALNFDSSLQLKEYKSIQQTLAVPWFPFEFGY